MFIVEVRPDWNIATGEPGSSEWAPAMPASIPNREDESTFDTEDAGIAFRRALLAIGTLNGLSAGPITDYTIRVRPLT